MRRVLLLPLILAAAAIAVASIAGAQPSAQPTPEPDPPTYSESAGAEYVMLPVLVTDKRGNYVDNLTKGDFVVRVEDSRVEFDTFEKDQTAPVSFAFLLDTSGSMSSRPVST